MAADIVMWGSLMVFNLAIVFLLRLSFKTIDLKEVLREKSAPTGGGGNGGDSGAPVPVGQAGSDNTSYSRLAGMVGAIVLAAFFWALGDVILFKLFAPDGTTQITAMMAGLSTYFLSGTALFAPYAFNQVSAIFKN